MADAETLQEILASSLIDKAQRRLLGGGLQPYIPPI